MFYVLVNNIPAGVLKYCCDRRVEYKEEGTECEIEDSGGDNLLRMISFLFAPFYWETLISAQQGNSVCLTFSRNGLTHTTENCLLIYYGDNTIKYEILEDIILFKYTIMYK